MAALKLEARRSRCERVQVPESGSRLLVEEGGTCATNV